MAFDDMRLGVIDDDIAGCFQRILKGGGNKNARRITAQNLTNILTGRRA